MSAAALALVVASAALHAGWNALLKRQEDVAGATRALQLLTALTGILLALIDPRATLGPARSIGWGAAAGLFEAGYFFTLAAALTRTSLGVAYTVARGGSLVLLWPVSLVCLGECVTPGVAAGVLLVRAGLVAVSRDLVEPLRAGGAGWAGLCAACIAGYGVCYKQALAGGAAPTALFALSLGVSLPAALIGAGRGGLAGLRRALARAPATLAAATLASASSFLLVLLALSMSGAGAVMTLRNVSVVFALVFSAALGEVPRPLQVAGGILVAAGAILVGWPR